ncbi:hypothetical protein NAB79_19620 [Proteus mirabilis]|nr:hypothetical protein [Proteus mirabilis]
MKRVLDKMEGVESFDINKEEQKVTVIGNVQPDAVFQTVAKTGKKTAFWEVIAPVEPEAPKETETKLTEAPTEPESKPAEVPTKTEAKPAEVPTKPEAKPAETVATA